MKARKIILLTLAPTIAINTVCLSGCSTTTQNINREINIDYLTKDKIDMTQEVKSNGDLVITLVPKDSTQEIIIKSVTIGDKALSQSDYSWSNNKLTITKEILDTYTGNISILTSLQEKYVHTSKFFKTSEVEDTVYVVTPPSENYNQWYVTLQSLQGILAQTKAKIFIKTTAADRNSWFEPMQEKMGFKSVSITDPAQILNEFASAFNNQYVLYKDNVRTETVSDTNLSIDKATTIAAAENVLMVEEKLEDTIKALGFTKFDDASNYTTKELFNKYKDKLNNIMLINQRPDNLNLRDYAIASKSFTTYLDYVNAESTEGGEATCKKILSWTEPNSPILGWNEDEVKFVEAISQYSKVVTPSDHCCNLSFYSAYNPEKLYTQKHKTKIKAQQGKHYVAIVMSDGDNIQWLQSNFTDKKYFGSEYRGQFPLNWTLSPAPYDVNGVILDKLYKEQSDNDNFICGPSGYGYINYDRYGTPNDFAKLSANYMKAVDMKVAHFIDFYNDYKNPDAFIYPMKQDQIVGGVWGFGDWYLKGKGGVYWRNDKPIICMRDGLWKLGSKSEEEQPFKPEATAARINNYTTNPNEISGYTIVSAHVWSYGEMDSVKKFVDLLDKSHVELVTCEQLIDMVKENVPHVDVEKANDYAPILDE